MKSIIDVDDAGMVVPQGAPEPAPPSAIAARACRALTAFTFSNLEVRSVDVHATSNRHRAEVLVSEEWHGGQATRTGHGMAGDPARAVVASVLDAFCSDGDLIATGLARLHARGSIPAVVLSGVDGERYAAGSGPNLARLRLLSETWRSHGHLSIVTDTSRFRLFQTPAVSLSLIVSNDEYQTSEVDCWLALLARALNRRSRAA